MDGWSLLVGRCAFPFFPNSALPHSQNKRERKRQISGQRRAVLTYKPTYRKRIEKSIKESQEKSEGLKMEVRDPIPPRRIAKQVEDIIANVGGIDIHLANPAAILITRMPKHLSPLPAQQQEDYFPKTSLSPLSIRTTGSPQERKGQ